MKKKMIFVAVIIGTVASLGVLRAMHNRAMHNENESQRKELPGDQIKQHHGVLPRNLQKDLLPAAIQGGSRERGESQGIEGRVMDHQGNPAAGVDVIAMSSGQGPRAGALLKSRTDKEGYFIIKGMPAGTYEVYALEKDGPICPTCLFSSGGSPPQHVATESVLEGRITLNIVLQKPPKSAKLMGRVVDAETKEPIVASRITLRRMDNPDYFFETGPDEKGNFIIPVPTVAVTMEVRSPGYEQWNYVREDLPLVLTRVDSLKLNRGESRKLEVRLRKKAS